MSRLVRRYGWELLLVVLIVLAGIWSSFLSPYFLDPVTLLSSASFFVIFALMAFGLFPIILQGEIDISLTSTLAVGSVLLARLSHTGMPLAVALPIVLIVCGLLGAVNGLLVAVVGLPSLAVTLGTMGAYQGIAYLLAGDAGVTQIPPSYVALGSSWIGMVPMAVVLAVVVAIVFGVLTSATRFGRNSHAIGNNASASRMAGLSVSASRVGAYALAGVASGLAGFVWLAQYQSARGDNASGGILFVITAVVLGGVSIKGGTGRAVGVFLSILLLGTIQTGMKLANIPGTNQTLVIGALLVCSIGVPRIVTIVRKKIAAARPAPRVETEALRKEPVH